MIGGEFLDKYWYVLVIIALAIGFFIYSKADNYTKSRIRKIFSGKTLLAIVFVVVWFFWHRQGEISTVSNANRYMPVILALLLAGYNYMGALRYETQQLIAPNFHGSYSKPPKYVDGFYIFAIDSFNAGGLSWDYAGRIVILREETVELFNEGAVTIANLSFVSKYQLPVDVQEFVEKNKFFKRALNECYYGWFDDISEVDWNFEQLSKLDEEHKSKTIYNMLKKELKVDNPKVSMLYWLYRNQSKALGKQTEWFDTTVDAAEKGAEHGKRMKDVYVDKQDPPPKSEGYEEGY